MIFVLDANLIRFFLYICSAMKDIRLFLMISLLCLCKELKAEGIQVSASPLPFYNQIYSNEIFDIHQDREGYVWIGTTSALSRWNGKKVENFYNDYSHPLLLSDNSITYITDNSHYVWIGTNRGLTLYDKQKRHFRVLENSYLRNQRIKYVMTDDDDQVWVAAGKRVFCYAPDATQEQLFDFSGESDSVSINSLYQDRRENIFTVTNCGIFLFDRIHRHFFRFKIADAAKLACVLFQDHDDNYWIGTWGNGLWHLAGGEIKRFHFQDEDKNDRCVFSIEQDNSECWLWMLTYNGLKILKNKDESYCEVNLSERMNQHKMFTVVRKDNRGNLWLGSYDTPYIISFDRKKVANYLLEEMRLLQGWDANLLNIVVQGHIAWLSQDRYGLCLYDLDTGKLQLNTQFHKDCHLSEVDLLVSDVTHEQVWAHQRGGGVFVRLSQHHLSIKEEERFDLAQQIANPGYILNMTVDKNGNLWILTDTHVFVKRRGTSTPLIADAMAGSCSAPAHTTAICRTPGGEVLCLGHIDALHNGESITQMSVDCTGCVWAATNLGRVFHSDNHQRNYEECSLNKKLSDGDMLQIIADGHFVWFVTNKKVLRYDIHNRQSDVFTAGCGGVAVDIFRMKAACGDGNGGLFVGGHGGFSHIFAESITYKELSHVTNSSSLFTIAMLSIILLIIITCVWMYRIRYHRHVSVKDIVVEEQTRDIKNLAQGLIGEDVQQENQQFRNLITTVDAHISDSEFDMEQLANALTMSRSTLHRRVKVLTGMTPHDFIQTRRLECACDKLRKGGMNVSEVAYAVGFTSPKYFTKCFKEKYGRTPTDYQKG